MVGVGGRPKGDRTNTDVAKTHVRVSPKTKALLDQLRLDGGYKTTDEALYHFLSVNQPDINKLISSASGEIMRKINNDRPSQPKSKPVHNKHSWQQRRKF